MDFFMMKYFVSLFAMVLLVSSCNADTKNEQSISGKDVKLSTTIDSVSYILGVQIGSQLRQDSIKPTIEAIAAGVQDALDDKIKLNDSVRNTVIQSFVAELQKKQQALQQAEMDKQKAL